MEKNKTLVANRRCATVKALILHFQEKGLIYNATGGCESYYNHTGNFSTPAQVYGRFCYCFQDGCNDQYPHGNKLSSETNHIMFL